MNSIKMRALASASAGALIALTAGLTLGVAQTPSAPAEKISPDPVGTPAMKDDDSGTMKRADRDMRRVLQALAKLGGKPIETLSPEEARKQPTPTDAVAAVLKEMGKDPAELKAKSGVKTQDLTYPAGDGGMQPVRIYTPEKRAASGQQGLPVILYIHGGGWVIADIDTYDGGARALAKKANAIVVSIEYRHAPEHKFPAAHEDSFAAYKWVLANAAQWGGDPTRVAVAGESAGGNMAAGVAIMARDQKVQAPLHMLLVYPVAGVDLNTPSYRENANAKPLNKAMIEWFVKHTLPPEHMQSPLIDLVGKADLKGLPDATIITAEIDVLTSEGKALADKLKQAGSEVKYQNYSGVTHEFFGMDAVVKDAERAQDLAARELQEAFAETQGSSRPSRREK